MKTSTVIAIAIVVLIIAGAAVYYYEANYSVGKGTLSLAVTDAPIGSVSHLYLTISSIELQGNGNSSTTYQAGSIQFDLLSLLNVTKLLGNVSIPAGNYTMIRFTVSSAVATIAGVNSTLNVPSGEVKLPVQFQVKSGETTRIVVDITADMTIISASGNLRPVVTVKSIVGP